MQLYFELLLSAFTGSIPDCTHDARAVTQELGPRLSRWHPDKAELRH